MNRLHTTISLAKHSVRFSVMNDDIANPNSDQAVEAEIEVYPSADGGLTTASFCPDPVTAPPIVAEAIAKHSQSDVAIVCVDLMDNNQLNGITFGYAKRLIDAVKGNPVLVHLANLLRVEIVDFELNPYTGDIARGQIGDMRFQMVMNKDGITTYTVTFSTAKVLTMYKSLDCWVSVDHKPRYPQLGISRNLNEFVKDMELESDDTITELIEYSDIEITCPRWGGSI